MMYILAGVVGFFLALGFFTSIFARYFNAENSGIVAGLGSVMLHLIFIVFLAAFLVLVFHADKKYAYDSSMALLFYLMFYLLGPLAYSFVLGTGFINATFINLAANFFTGLLGGVLLLFLSFGDASWLKELNGMTEVTDDEVVAESFYEESSLIEE